MRSKLLLAVVCLAVGSGFTALFTSTSMVGADCPGEPGTVCGNGDVNGDGLLDISDVLYLARYLFTEGREIAAVSCASGCALPATGQTTCYIGVQPWDEIDCASVEFPGQDGSYRAGCPTEGRFVDNGDGTVTDNCTGLMWQQATADVNGDGEITDAEHPAGDSVDWQHALQYCESLESAGHTDWRLPNVIELQSIVDYERFDPAIDPVFSADMTWYWTSSSDVSTPVYAWRVIFLYGDVDSHRKNDYTGLRAVRTIKPGE